ncbi:MAG: GIY-YIG nuclease family protein [Kiritimatiellae bacterium]|nr:GIY-YIG nuclease family protein [Kiritimatiellia bacterium]MCZ7592112.1 GIY-YIG nuclease family protein [Kiritimatiellia bacterium]MCZ7592114.1 GIY-YIG nuclease family protein [Kiritimatiellia bacterium]
MEPLEPRPAAYAVLCGEKRDYLYKGATRDMRKRWADHHAGRVSSTKKRKPLELVWIEYFDTYTEARKREIFLKSGVGRAMLEEHITKKIN